MRRHTSYPRLVTTTKREPGEEVKECRACASPATHLVTAETGPGRRDYLGACGRHESMARTSFERFWKHVGSKEEFLVDPDALKEDARRRRAADR